MEQVPILSKPRVQERETVSVGVPLHSTPPATDSQSGIASLPVMSGLDAPVSPCLQFRLRRFTPSLPSPSVSSSLPAPTCSASTSGSDCPPPARLTRAKVRATVHYSQDSARAGRTVIHRISVRASGSCRGLRPCPLCHLCPATATAIAVAASGPKQHRPSDERPLRPRCEVQRHHPPERRCREYINLAIIHYLCT